MLSLLVRRGTEAEIGSRLPAELRRRLRRRMERVMAAAGCPDAVVCLSLSDDAELCALNREYADEDHATDVLSFAQAEASGPSLSLMGAPLLLGDIIISIETAARQAGERGDSLDAELLHLATHGFCHLLGYDHATPEEERVMFGYEALLREQALSGRPVQSVPRPRLPRRKAGRPQRPTAHELGR